MSRIRCRIAATLLAALASGLVAPVGEPSPGSAAGAQGFVAGEILIELRSQQAEATRARLDASGALPGARTGIASLDALGRRHGVRRMRSILTPARLGAAVARGKRLTGFFRLELERSGGELEALDQYRSDPAVRSAQLDYLYAPDLIPNDPAYSNQYAHRLTHAEQAWSITTGSPAIVIAVIGTGVELSHPDLAAKIVPGWDFSGGDPDPSPTGEGHETSVAGVAAAATNNMTGMAGVCWGCGLMPLKVDYTTVQVAQAIDFAVDHGARVVNMSFGNYDVDKYGPDSAVGAEIEEGVQSGAVMVATAGNDSIDLKRYPGADENVIGVAATDADDHRAYFSNWGSWVDVAAPGDTIYSTGLSGTYGYVNGTSFSAPYISGVAGLILSKNPALSPLDVRLMIEYSADEISPDQFIGTGRVNAAAAVALDGPPPVAAVIKSPVHQSTVVADTIDIWGTALGESYLLETKPQSSSVWSTVTTGPLTIDGTLGVLDLTGQPGGAYDVRLTATRGSLQAQDEITIFLIRNVHQGWPQNVGSFVLGAPVYADLDGDGQQEIVVAGESGRVHVWRQDGTPFPGWPQYAPLSPLFASPSVGDIDGDGDLEIVVTTYYGARVAAFHHDGSIVNGFPMSAGRDVNDQIRTSAALIDLDADGALEIVVATTEGLVHVYRGTGSVEMPGWPRTVTLNVQTSPAAGDVDGDGQMEIVIRQYNEIDVFNADGTMVTGWPVYATGYHVSPALADVDGDGSVEILDGQAYGIVAFRGDATVLFSASLSESIQWDSLALGDLDHDGRLEIFVPSQSAVYGFSSTGAPLPGWPVQVAPNTQGGMRGPIIADIDGDGDSEVVFGAPDGRLHAWDLAGNEVMSPISLGSGIWTSLAAGDVDADGSVNLLAGTAGGDVYLLDFPGTWDPATAEWPMFQGDARHTGHYRFVEFYRDSDGDGDPDLTDCRPQDPAVHHGVFEACNGVDDDCSGAVDDQDLDHDGSTACGGVDCDDSRATVRPGAAQICGDDLNNDCNDPAWPAPPPGETDADGDGVRVCAGDCDDTRASVYPGAPQICGDGLNNDCRRAGWPSLIGTNETDDDADGYTDCQGDCDDTRAGVYPGAPEVCDGVNNDCNDPAWPARPPLERDDDLDGFGACSDCDDTWPYTYPGAPQICGDGRNTDCNDPAWPALPTAEIDHDGDGFAACQGDCDETRNTVYPAAPQICDGLNNDCRTWNWPSLAGTNDADDDGDGFSECGLDCNDTVAAYWHTPGEARALTFSTDGLQLSWQSPALPGAASVSYDVIRVQDDASNFVTLAACLESDDGGDTIADASEYPYIGGIFYYVVRARNGCGAGPAGVDSWGSARPARTCP